MSNKSEKIQLTKEINSLADYLKDVDEQVCNQHPQPNGDIYLLGEVIARKRGATIYLMPEILKAQRELMNMRLRRKNMDSDVPDCSPSGERV